ncbi:MULTISPECIES: AAA family ATPase [Mycobacteriaceae]|uniref:AAA family ATPase n=1 Tax=Mycobacteriaceae TaxID=1762 RepID=UPI0013F698C5|nr:MULTISPECIES: AAA family ATPase [Mycobacteriaceae]
MFIERLRVESEGFLAGLDVRFDPGLNVIIGARGTGKTSIIELIRFCLGADAFTETAASRGRQQAIAILEGGAATVSVNDGNQKYEFTRSAASHDGPRLKQPKVACTVLAQSEVEAVGAQASGRLHLIDRFRQDRDADRRTLDSLESRLASLTAEVATIVAEGRAVVDEIESYDSVEEELLQAKTEQEQALSSSEATLTQREQLNALQEAGSHIAARTEILESDNQRLARFSTDLGRLANTSANLLQAWPADAGADPLVTARPKAVFLTKTLRDALETVRSLATELATAQEATQTLRANVDSESRQLRQRLDSVQAGIGQASRKVAELEEKNGRIRALKNALADLQIRYDSLVSERDQLYKDLDLQRTRLYEERQRIASVLTKELAPTIRVKVTRSENIEEYRSAIIAALRGSGIHYNALAPQIAREVSPHELARWVETNDSEALAAAISLRPDRAQSVISALSGPATASIISAHIDDGVSLSLLDGPEYKSSDQLSIGQRCTVVLPVLLGNHGDPLIVDQPEDHLDNAFIASTLVSALSRRHSSDQLIFSSHNANIPVLGEADRIIVMESDGQRGYVAHQGELDDPRIVEFVTRIMEGGIEAFAARSEFYEEKGVRDYDA